MDEVIHSVTRKARKEYHCDACVWLTADSDWRDLFKLTKGEIETIKSAENNGFKIQKGQKYICATMKGDEGIYTFRAIPEIHNICTKYDLYVE